MVEPGYALSEEFPPEKLVSYKLTSWPSLRTDVRNEGSDWVDEEVVQDGLITTSRKPDDLPTFNREMLKSFTENSHRRE